MSATNVLLKAVEITKRYQSAAGTEPVLVLDKIILEISASETIAVTGPSGSGKSTLLNIIGTLDHPTSGQIFLEEENLSGLPEEKLATIRNRQIGFVFQSHYLLPQCNVLENVLVPTLASKHNPTNKSAQERAVHLLKRVGLGERLTHRPGQLSGGERQRVAVVRALINQPKLVLADEPTGALDKSSAERLGDLLIELNREEKTTLIVVTHSTELADKMGRQFELKDGKLV